MTFLKKSCTFTQLKVLDVAYVMKVNFPTVSPQTLKVKKQLFFPYPVFSREVNFPLPFHFPMSLKIDRFTGQSEPLLNITVRG